MVKWTILPSRKWTIASHPMDDGGIVDAVGFGRRKPLAFQMGTGKSEWFYFYNGWWMTAKFKIGERVQLFGFSKYYKGEDTQINQWGPNGIWTVISTIDDDVEHCWFSNDGYTMQVRWDNGHKNVYKNRDLVYANEIKTKYKTGDIVKYITKSTSYGMIWTVREHRWDDNYCIDRDRWDASTEDENDITYAIPRWMSADLIITDDYVDDNDPVFAGIKPFISCTKKQMTTTNVRDLMRDRFFKKDGEKILKTIENTELTVADMRKLNRAIKKITNRLEDLVYSIEESVNRNQKDLVLKYTDELTKFTTDNKPAIDKVLALKI